MADTTASADVLYPYGGTQVNNLINILRSNDDNDIATLTFSPYMDLNSVKSYLQNNRNNFTVFTLNVQSLNSPSISKFQFKQTNPNEIISVINILPIKTSSGHDKISCIILKEIKDIIAQPLSLVVNQAFNTGVFPSKLKLAKVLPLFKKGD